MGKGIALMFKEVFPENFRAYSPRASAGEVQIGKMFVFQTGARLYRPAMDHQFSHEETLAHPSEVGIDPGFRSRGLGASCKGSCIQSVAVPPLGAGQGGLDWTQVREAIEASLSELTEADVVVYEPTGAYQAAPKRSGVEDLTPARAMIVDAIRRYSVLGFECTNLEVQKLAYFLQRVSRGLGLDDILKLQFEANRYGPYADALRHLLDALDGSYLHCQKRLHDAGPLDPIQLDAARLPNVRAYLASGAVGGTADALDAVERLIDGFQSPYLMELLSTVDWLLAQSAGASNADEILQAMATWPGGPAAGKRKVRLYKREAVALAVERLQLHSSVLYGVEATQ